MVSAISHVQIAATILCCPRKRLLLQGKDRALTVNISYGGYGSKIPAHNNGN